MLHTKILSGISIGCLSLSFIALSQPAFGVGFEILKPHRAIYDVELLEATDRSGIDSMSGRIVYEMKGNACEGISVNYRFVSRVNANGQIFTTDQRTASHETPDRNNYTFVTKSFVDERLDRIVKGRAMVEAGSTLVKLDSPDKREVELPSAQFVSGHLVEVLEKAKKGSNFFALDIFDGGDEADEILKTTNVIGSPKVYNGLLAGEKEKAIATLADDEAWPVTIGYFDQNITDSTEPSPIYEVSFLLYDGGVSRKLIMRYPDYELKAALVGLEMLESAACE